MKIEIIISAPGDFSNIVAALVEKAVKQAGANVKVNNSRPPRNDQLEDIDFIISNTLCLGNVDATLSVSQTEYN